MDNRLASLLQRGDTLTRAEYRVLAYLVDDRHPTDDQLSRLTVRTLAQETYVSTATILRLCHKLGFSGYSELLFHIKQLLNGQPATPALPEVAKAADLPAAFEHFIENYRRSFRFITAAKQQAFSQLLREEETFFLYGTGFSQLFAEYLTKKLQLLGKNALVSGLGDSRGIFLHNAAKYRVFIAISRSGETAAVLEKARIARNIGMTVVAFTRASANSLAQLCDLHLPLYDDASSAAAEAGESSSFESNLILLIDLLLLAASAPPSSGDA
ncbi:MurR/RpiR family transcriptional regulator [Nissabacter sp. SGAir0207]|uniref:MurR/RpiR family transcriptional regulator n=1 Tax=Nissabacter sp. SGAir0207 TaxID=2126321 RepID=UPI0010CD28A5|nr:MurR/RpiR family transcriptional regulator [Nissabacter sp. SGAir0207]QCR35287.1 MurR/RpiR family transcriptional regulator [Nissabacter sp. SGAir0207]